MGVARAIIFDYRVWPLFAGFERIFDPI